MDTQPGFGERLRAAMDAHGPLCVCVVETVMSKGNFARSRFTACLPMLSRSRHRKALRTAPLSRTRAAA